ncbi:hypothetical protein THAOC_34835 [Thalassiosira oceanica]|uniref:Uncharacterized protein n=1 Tax=Thalassiosira oceanica TaxID=159749 RepID=K0R4C4_THAOC|nr:hypothetical protein THAOC_34835 [Thalassiosira oceanica]|eukprot:EJK46494.1 hypothetical protein THAOC_34835 [Thalassiosira oceanica]
MKLTILTSIAGLAIAAAASSLAIDEQETFVYSVPPKSYQGQSAMEFWSELTKTETSTEAGADKTARTWTRTTGRGAARTATRTTARAIAAIAASSRATRVTPSAAMTPQAATSVEDTAATATAAASETLATAKSIRATGARGILGSDAADSASLGAMVATARPSAVRTILATDGVTRTNACAGGRRVLATHLRERTSLAS